MKTYEKIHAKALGVARRYREAEAEMLAVLQEVDRENAFLLMGHASLFKYSEHALQLAPAHAYDFINVARKAEEVPSLLEAVRQCRLTVAKARRICPVINRENAEDWIAKAEKLTHRELEHEVAKVRPESGKPDKARYVGEDTVELTFEVSEEVAKKFELAQDLVCQKRQAPASFAETLDAALEVFLEQELPQQEEELGTVPSSRVKKYVLARDQHRCTFTGPDGRRCESRRWLDVHHRIPRSDGGSNDPDNLVTLCSAHHRLMHEHSTL